MYEGGSAALPGPSLLTLILPERAAARGATATAPCPGPPSPPEPQLRAPQPARRPSLPAAGHGGGGAVLQLGPSGMRASAAAAQRRDSRQPAPARRTSPGRSSLAEPPRGRGGPSRSRVAGHRRAGPRVPRLGPAPPHLVRVRAASSPRGAAPAGLAAQRGADSPAGSLSSRHHLPPAATPAASTARHGPSLRSAPPFASARPPLPSWSRGAAGRCRHHGPRRWEARRWRPPGRAALLSAGCPNAPGEWAEPGPEPDPAGGNTGCWGAAGSRTWSQAPGQPFPPGGGHCTETVRLAARDCLLPVHTYKRSISHRMS